MCIIVDACVVDDLYLPSKEGKVVYDWVLEHGNVVVTKATLIEMESHRARKINAMFRHKRKIELVEKQAVNKVLQMIRKENRKKHVRLVSNDKLILALALASKCKLLYTKDTKLASDFENIVKGEVFTTGSDASFFEGKSCA